MCTKTDKNGNLIPKCKENFNDHQSPFLSIEHILSKVVNKRFLSSK